VLVWWLSGTSLPIARRLEVGSEGSLKTRRVWLFVATDPESVVPGCTLSAMPTSASTFFERDSFGHIR
jgi:hypothetical protein